MSCNKPLVGIPNGVSPETGKIQYKILPYSENYFKSGIPGVVAVPCGNCIGCRIDYSRMWANRCLMEMKYHDSSYFVTLTYNEETVPKVWYTQESTGEAFEAMTLRKKHFQLFMKAVRRRYPNQKIRYFAAGEYGDKTMRPHYHAILFGLKLDDLKLYNRSEKGYNYFTSVSLQNAWDVVDCKQGITPLASKGFVVVAECNWETCAYVARYVVKKMKGGQSAFYDYHNIELPFSLMSRRPGIGRQFYDEHKDMYEFDYINLSTPEGGRKFRPPKYFNRLLENDNPELALGEAEKRKFIAETMKQAKMAQSSLSYPELLDVEGNALSAKINAMKRSV